MEKLSGPRSCSQCERRASIASNTVANRYSRRSSCVSRLRSAGGARSGAECAAQPDVATRIAAQPNTQGKRVIRRYGLLRELWPPDQVPDARRVLLGKHVQSM